MMTSLRRSFLHAWRGLRLTFRTERSFRIQAAVCAVVALFMLVVPISTFERILLVLAMSAVLVLELLNSMVERLVDLFTPRLNELVGDIKDIMAGVVLVASAFAALIGIMIFWPYIGSMLFRV